jgi:hypothetical protein
MKDHKKRKEIIVNVLYTILVIFIISTTINIYSLKDKVNILYEKQNKVTQLSIFDIVDCPERLKENPYIEIKCRDKNSVGSFWITINKTASEKLLNAKNINLVGLDYINYEIIPYEVDGEIIHEPKIYFRLPCEYFCEDGSCIVNIENLMFLLY